MKMKQHLIDLFRYNDQANKRTLAKITELTERDESVRLFCHLINSLLSLELLTDVPSISVGLAGFSSNAATTE